MKLDLKYYRSLRIGGSADAIALSALLIALLISSPFFQKIGVIWPMILALGSGIHFSNKILSFWSNTGILGEALYVERKDHPIEEGDGLLLGFRLDNGDPVYVNDDLLTRHLILGGMTGSGKSFFMMALMAQQILRGEGLTYIDGKLDYQNLADMRAMCKWAGREHDLYVINPDNPSMSNTYNPILYYTSKDLVWSMTPNDILKDPDEVASAILSILPDTSNSAGSDYFKQAANQGLTVIVGALQEAKLAYNFLDLSILLTNEQAMMSLLDVVPDGTAAKKSLRLFLNMFMRTDKGKTYLDANKMKEVFGGIGGRLHLFGTENFGKITSSYEPDINMFNAILENRIVYLMLPVLAKDLSAINMAKMFIADVRVASARIQKMPAHLKPKRCHLMLLDEAAGYSTDTIKRMVETFRSARISLLFGLQSLSGFDDVSEALTDSIMGNTYTKVMFKTATQDTAERFAEFYGKEKVGVATLIESDSESASFKDTSLADTESQGIGAGAGWTEREDEDYKISADQFKQLKIGEAALCFGGTNVYHLKIPAVRPSQELYDSLGDFVPNRHNFPRRKGIELFKQANRFISDNLRASSDDADIAGSDDKGDSADAEAQSILSANTEPDQNEKSGANPSNTKQMVQSSDQKVFGKGDGEKKVVGNGSGTPRPERKMADTRKGKSLANITSSDNGFGE